MHVDSEVGLIGTVRGFDWRSIPLLGVARAAVQVGKSRDTPRQSALPSTYLDQLSPRLPLSLSLWLLVVILTL